MIDCFTSAKFSRTALQCRAWVKSNSVTCVSIQFRQARAIEKLVQPTCSRQPLSPGDVVRTRVGGGISQLQHRWTRVGRTRIDAAVRGWQITARRMAHRFRIRTFVLVGNAFMATRNSRDRFPDTRMDCVERVPRHLSGDVALAAQWTIKTRQLVATLSRLTARRGGVGGIGNDPRTIPQWFSVGYRRQFAMATHTAHPDRIRHQRVWRFISRRLDIAESAFCGTMHPSQSNHALRLDG